MSLDRMPSIFRRQTTAPANGQASGLPTAEQGHNSLKELRDQISKGLPINLNTSSLSALIDVIQHSESIDDRKMLLEHALTFTSRLEPGSFQTMVQNKIVELLYNDLPHPPATSISNKYAWRTADGSNNNPDLPELGKSGTPYSRSVQQSLPLPKDQLPDPGLIFDTLLKRDGFVKHPAGLSSLMFSFAALVIHSVFRTSHRDPNINETSSYVDLGPLYGNNQEEQDRVRVRDGRGLLKPDVFSEDRLLLLPPAVCALLVLFNRNHNYIAKKLLEINERGAYKDPAKLKSDDPASKAKLMAQEEELFQIARLVNCGWFGSVIFSDYFSCILGLVREGSSWSLNPFGEIRNEDHTLFERGRGNICSVEFNCLYRWHATTSVEDEKWVGETFTQIFDGKSPDEVTPADFQMAARKIQQMEPDIAHWTFGRLQRNEDGTFKDDDLANLLQNATEHPAGKFRARGTPAVMRLHEIMGIEANRRWGVCSLNDFRKYLGLKTYDSFLEWNPDPEIADAAEKLYGDINHLELYVGLQAEESKPVITGAGLCPGYTISRAILSDAIALTRGDRHFTHDYTPFNLTAWGFADCQRDPDAFGFGSTLGRLFLRTLPNNFTENSVYTFFPLMTPDSMKVNLTKLNKINKYDLSRPKVRATIQTISDYNTVATILSDNGSFKNPYATRAARVISGKGFFPAEGIEAQRAVSSALCGSEDFINKIGQYFYETTRKLIASNSFSVVGGKTCGVDIVRDVLKVVPLCWVATDIAGIQLKTKEHPGGAYSASELFDMLGEIYSFIFLDVELSKVMVLEEKVQGHVRSLLSHIKSNISGTVGNRLSIAGMVDMVSSMFSKPRKSQYHYFVERLYELGHSTDQVANAILGVMVVSTVELSLGLTNMVNLYLGTDYEKSIIALSKDSSAKNELNGYVYEALRIDPSFSGVYRISTKNQSVQGMGLKNDDRVFLDISRANLNPTVFASPDAVNISRSTKALLLGDGAAKYLTEALTVKIMSEVLRAVFSQQNVRRADGQSGTLKRFKDDTRRELRYAYLNKGQFISEWPTSLFVLYDPVA